MIVTPQITFDEPAIPVTSLSVPAPAAYAAGGRTPGGLPYPLTSDKLNQTDQYVADLADAAAKMIANPGLVVASSPVTTAADGRVWMSFTALSYVTGLVVQVFTGGWQIMPWVVQRSANQALVAFPYIPFNVNDSVPKPYVGTLTAIVWAWGTPT